MIQEVVTIEALTSVPHIAYEIGDVLISAYDVLEEMGARVRFSLRTHDFATIPSLVSGSRNIAIVQSGLACGFGERRGIRTMTLPI